MKKTIMLTLLSISLYECFCTNANAQNFLKVGTGVSFSQDKKFVQTFSFDLNRTEEVKEKSSGYYFLYTPDAFYIVPTVDVNVGESIAASENNVTGQVTFGKKLGDGKEGIKTTYYRMYLEASPIYSADKDFDEKKYYSQLKFLFSKIFSGYDLSKKYFPWVLSLNVNPLLNLGIHSSKPFATTQRFFAGGLNTEFKFRINSIDTAKKITEVWSIKVSTNGYRIYDEVRSLYNKGYYGQLNASIDRAINSKYGVSVTYKYGNDNPKYTTANVLEAGFKIKY